MAKASTHPKTPIKKPTTSTILKRIAPKPKAGKVTNATSATQPKSTAPAKSTHAAKKVKFTPEVSDDEQDASDDAIIEETPRAKSIAKPKASVAKSMPKTSKAASKNLDVLDEPSESEGDEGDGVSEMEVDDATDADTTSEEDETEADEEPVQDDLKSAKGKKRSAEELDSDSSEDESDVEADEEEELSDLEDSGEETEGQEEPATPPPIPKSKAPAAERLKPLAKTTSTYPKSLATSNPGPKRSKRPDPIKLAAKIKSSTALRSSNAITKRQIAALRKAVVKRAPPINKLMPTEAQIEAKRAAKLEAFCNYFTNFHNGKAVPSLKDRIKTTDFKRNEGGKIDKGFVVNGNGCIVERLTERQWDGAMDFSKCKYIPIKRKDLKPEQLVQKRAAELKTIMNRGGIRKSQMENVLAVIRAYEINGGIKPKEVTPLDNWDGSTFWLRGEQIDAFKAKTSKTLDEVWMEDRIRSAEPLVKDPMDIDEEVDKDDKPNELRTAVTKLKKSWGSGDLYGGVCGAGFGGPAWDKYIDNHYQPRICFVESTDVAKKAGRTRNRMVAGKALNPNGLLRRPTMLGGDFTRSWDFDRWQDVQLPYNLYSPQLNLKNAQFDRGLLTWGASDLNYYVQVALRYPPHSADPNPNGPYATYKVGDKNPGPNAVVVDLLFDTGASYPQISQEILNALDENRLLLTPKGENLVTVATTNDVQMSSFRMQYCFVYKGRGITDWMETEFLCPHEGSVRAAIQNNETPPDCSALAGFALTKSMHFMLPKFGPYLIGFTHWRALYDAWNQGLVEFEAGHGGLDPLSPSPSPYSSGGSTPIPSPPTSPTP